VKASLNSALARIAATTATPTYDGTKSVELDSTSKVVTIHVSKTATAADVLALAELNVAKILDASDVEFAIEAGSKTDLNAVKKAFADKYTDAVKSETVKTLLRLTNEVKFTGTTGLVGIHAGYLHKINACFGLGALVEGTWSFGKDLKIDSVEVKDFRTRFGANILARAAYFMTHNAFIGADLGVAVQEFRYLKPTATKADEKASKWLWAPMARAVVGFAMTDNLAVTVTAGGSLPIKQDFKDLGLGDRKVKYYNVQGNVGVSYYFGA